MIWGLGYALTCATTFVIFSRIPSEIQILSEVKVIDANRQVHIMSFSAGGDMNELRTIL